ETPSFTSTKSSIITPGKSSSSPSVNLGLCHVSNYFSELEIGLPTSNATEEKKLDWLRSQIIGSDAEFDSPFGKRRLTYADHTASGRSLYNVENFILKNVLPFYGNTHTSDSYVGHRTTKMLQEATQYIKSCLGGTSNDAIMFCGQGTTSAIKRLQEVMGIAVPSIVRDRSLAEVIEIGLDDNGLVDLEALRQHLESFKASNRPILGSFSACSNVTGILSDTRAIAQLLHQYGAFACFDFAASGPYVEINMKSGEIDGYDAVVLSPHKFLCGPGSPGVLLMNKALYKLGSSAPSAAGGGTVNYVNGFDEKDTLYLDEIEERENGGTPQIIQTIRAALAFWVKEYITHQVISNQEHKFIERALNRLLPNENVWILGNTTAERQAILSFMIFSTTNIIESPTQAKNDRVLDLWEETGNARDKPLHGAYVAALLNDLFGIQSRGGCACAGPYGHDLLHIDQRYSLAIRKHSYIRQLRGASNHKDVARSDAIHQELSSDAIMFCGQGTTSAIKRLQEVMGIGVPSIMRDRVITCLSNEERWVVFVGPYEHHSNLLSWRQSLAEVIEIGLDGNGLVDLEALRQRLESFNASNRPILGSFSACSNVTGILSDTRAIAQLLHQYGGFACFDFAASGPYMKIDMKSGQIDGYDAVVLSPHKFLGGPGSPGVLLMNKALYQLRSSAPSAAGGGTVSYVNGFDEKDTLYLDEIEERENGGTPQIIQTIRAALAFWVKEYITHQVISNQEHKFIERALNRLLPNENVWILGNTTTERQAILSFMIFSTTNIIESPTQAKNDKVLDLWEETGNVRDKPLHGAYVAALLNDLFGIQSRGGCACAGPYGHDLLHIDHHSSLAIRSAVEKGYVGAKPGWTRVSFPYYMSTEEFNFILEAIEFVAIYGQRFLPYYRFSWRTGSWTLRKKALRDIISGKENIDSTQAWQLVCHFFPVVSNLEQHVNKTESNISASGKPGGLDSKFASYLESAIHMANMLPKFPPHRRIPHQGIDTDFLYFRQSKLHETPSITKASVAPDRSSSPSINLGDLCLVSDYFRQLEIGLPKSKATEDKKLAWLRSQIIGNNAEFHSSFGKRRLTYADHTASGRSLYHVENFIIKNVLPFYGNTHTTDSYVGHRTTKMWQEATHYIKSCLGGTSNDAIMLCGQGTTSAIKRLQEVMGIAVPSILRDRVVKCLSNEERWVVFVGPYEHHSNLLSWRQSLAEVIEIGLDEDGLVDIEALRQHLESFKASNRPILGSFSACSNDSGPYMEIDMKSGEIDGYDAVVLSPHKFLGGPGSPGVLLMNKALYQLKSSAPSTPGGGTVNYVNGFDDKDTLYLDDIEERENGGTPQIIQTIRAALAFWVKEYISYQVIANQEHKFITKALERLLPNENVWVLGNTTAKRLAILSFLIFSTTTNENPTQDKNDKVLHIWDETGHMRYKPFHGAYVAALLNDLFGIQSRGGCACAGPYGHDLLHIDQPFSLAIRSAIEKGYVGAKPGWTRVSFPYYMSDEEFNFVLDAIEFVAIYGQRFLPFYCFNWRTGSCILRKKALRDIIACKEKIHNTQASQLTCQSPVISLEHVNNKDSNNASGEPAGLDCKFTSYLESAIHIANMLPSPPQNSATSKLS
ncbi:hypothetical protein Tsubulata_011178, partial [Turnera subulata]